MNTISISAKWIATLGLLLTACNLQANESKVEPTMAGQWEGNARIIVAWCHQKNLSVAVDIQPDGSVTGRVGDAKLVSGRFKRNRGWLGRKLKLATDFIITGSLSGPIVAKESITRSRVSIPLNFANGTFVGGINTSGLMFGGKDKMILSAMSLTLAHPR
jgi:hypothetical protein